MRIAFNPSTVEALITPPNNKDITFDLRGHNIFARGVKFCGTDTNTWRDIKINNVSIGSNILDLRNGSNTTLTNTNGVVTINSTWRPVVDNLTSDSTNSSLSANLGKILAGLINGKSDSEHNHDDQYLKLTGGTMTGNIILSPLTTIIKPLRSTYCYDTVAIWSVDGEIKKYGREIGLYNMGGSDTTGSITIVPYKTDTAPWLGTVGLFIAKNALKLDGKPIAFTTDIPTSLKNPCSLTTFGVVYDGSAAKVVGPSNFISLLEESTSVVTDGTMFITSWASNSGFADTNAVNVPYKRKAIHLWEYVKAKTDSLYATKSHNHDDRYLKLTGGTLTGDLYINTNLYGPARGNNPRNRYDAALYFFNCNSSTTSTYNFGLYLWDNEFQFTYRTSADNIFRGNAFTIQGSDGQVTFTKTPKVGSTLVSLNGHTHAYLPLSGGTMSGTIYRNSGGSTISGRDHAIIRLTYAPGGSSWNPIACVDTETGTWTLGHLSSGSSDTNFHFCFSTNADYNAGNNNGNYVTLRNKVGTIALLSDIPSSLKNPHALTISLNGTSQGPYDGSAAKNINITPSSIGAATSDHNHDGRYVYNYGGTQMDGASINKNALGMTTNSGITEDWWHILQAAWNSEYRWNSLIAFPTLNRNGMYYRSGLDDNTAWGAWVKLLDTNNYSSILDSRYYTESEVNSLLSNYYPITGGNMSGDNRWIGSTMGGGSDYWRIGGSGSGDTGTCIITIGDNYDDKFAVEIADWQGSISRPLEAIYTGINTLNIYTNGTYRLLYSNSANGSTIHSILNYSSSPYGLLTRIYNDGCVSLQSQRESSNSEVFSLSLNPLGGNIGIGTTSPLMKLHVNGDGIYLNSAATCGINMYSSHSESSISYKSIDGIRTVLGTYTNRTFLWNESIGEHVSILSSNGYFGIGTSNPYYKLDVIGSLRIYSTYPLLRIENSSGGTAETSIYISNGTAGWAIGVNPWGVGSGVFGIGQYSGSGSSNWRFKIDNSGYCYTQSYLNLGAGNEKNASSPPYVWGVNGSDNYLRTYATSALRVAYASSAGYANGIANRGLLDSQEKIDNFITANRFEYATFKIAESNNVGFDSNDGMILSIPWDSTVYGAQIAFDDVISGTVKIRSKNKSWGNWHTLLHSGNYNSYSPTLIGTGANGTWGISITGNAYTATKSEYSRSLLGRNTSGSDYGAIADNLVFAEWNTMNDSRWYLKATDYECRVAYASSAVSATKLETARNIFGLPFDGTNDIGALSFLIDNNIDTDTSAIKWTAKIIGKYTSSYTGGQGLLIGAVTDRKYCRGGGIAAYATNVWGNSTNLAIYKSSGNDYDVKPIEVITITDNLNVGIDTTSPAYKLHVEGDIYSTEYVRASSGFVKNGSSDSYVLLGGGGHKAISDFITSGHNHDDRYLKLAGGTMLDLSRIGVNGDLYIGDAGNGGWLYFQDIASLDGAEYWSISTDGSAGFEDISTRSDVNVGGLIYRGGISSSWNKGRDNALLRDTSSSGYHPLWSLKTTNGSWDFGEYNKTEWNNIPVLSYVTDTQYNGSSPTYTYQIRFPLASGTVALTSNIPNPTNYYWADVKVSSSPSTTTSPTFLNLATTNKILRRHRNLFFTLPFFAAYGLINLSTLTFEGNVTCIVTKITNNHFKISFDILDDIFRYLIFLTPLYGSGYVRVSYYLGNGRTMDYDLYPSSDSINEVNVILINFKDYTN